MELLMKWDTELLLAINRLTGSWLDPLLGWPTHLGFIAIAVPLVFLSVWIFDHKNLKQCFFNFVVPVGMIDLLVRLMKYLVARPRPYDFLAQQILEGEVKLNLIFGPATSNYSFPSGHAALAFATAVILNDLYKGKLAFLYLLAVLIAVSRIYTGVHYPSDVIGGILIGVLGALLSIYVLKKRTSTGSQED